jgi:hypothetical protein
MDHDIPERPHDHCCGLTPSDCPVSLYFFTIRDSDRKVKDDPHGTNLPNVAAVLSHAERIISERRYEFGYDNPQLIMIVQDEYRHSVWSLPFLPACA